MARIYNNIFIRGDRGGAADDIKLAVNSALRDAPTPVIPADK